MEECSEKGGPHFPLHYDVSKAYRQIPVIRAEKGRQACQITGTAAEASKASLACTAEDERKQFETTGIVREDAPKRAPRIEDLPAEVADKTIWPNRVGALGVGSAGYL